MRKIYCLWQEGDVLPRLWFDTKEAAEVAARMLYPEEWESVRYNRIFVRDLLTMQDVKPEIKRS